MTIPIALQLYSVRDEAARDLLDTMRRVRAMGFDAVEFAGYHGHSAADIKAVLTETGLEVAGTHIGLDQFTPDKFDATIAFHKTIGCDNLIVPWLPPEKRNSRAACEATAKELAALVDKLRPHGMRTGFHCHAEDMKPIDGSKSAWDILAANTPREFVLQYDTANGMGGGADPLQPILDHPGRGLSTHLKEYRKAGGHGVAALGEGDVPLKAVCDACEKTAGTEWFVVEQEGHKDLPPMEAAHRSLVNLKKVLGR